MTHQARLQLGGDAGISTVAARRNDLGGYLTEHCRQLAAKGVS